MAKQFDLELQKPPNISALFLEPNRAWAATISYDFDGRFGEGYDPINVNLKSLEAQNLTSLATEVAVYISVYKPVAMAAGTTSQDLADIQRLVAFGRHFDPVIEYFCSEEMQTFFDMEVGPSIEAISSLLEISKDNFGSLLGPWMTYGLAMAMAFNNKTEKNVLSSCQPLKLKSPISGSKTAK